MNAYVIITCSEQIQIPIGAYNMPSQNNSLEIIKGKSFRKNTAALFSVHAICASRIFLLTCAAFNLF